MLRTVAAIITVLIAASAASASPPGYGPGADLLPPIVPGVSLPPLSAPDQSEAPPLLSSVDQAIGEQSFAINGHDVFVNLDGTVAVTPAYAIVSLRFGTRSRYSLALRRALENTFAERAMMKREYDTLAMASALEDLPNYLESVWTHERWDPMLRRRVLFKLWDECAERGNSDLVRGGEDARKIIELYIKWRLPAGSSLAFTPAELDALNRLRTSDKLFSPYHAIPNVDYVVLAAL